MAAEVEPRPSIADRAHLLGGRLVRGILRRLAVPLLLPTDVAWAWRTRVGKFVRRSDPTALASSGGTLAPVLLIPGVYETWHFLEPIGERLAAAGHPVHALPDLRRNVLPIVPTAHLVAEYLEAKDLRDVVIVAHSKGGLVGKHVMAFDDPDGRIDRMIAIASPFSGTVWANILRVPALRVFSPKDELLRMLAADLETNSRIISIYPTRDLHVPEGSRLDGARNIRLGMSGHFRVLGARVTLDLVERFAGEPPPER